MLQIVGFISCDTVLIGTCFWGGGGGGLTTATREPKCSPRLQQASCSSTTPTAQGRHTKPINTGIPYQRSCYFHCALLRPQASFALGHMIPHTYTILGDLYNTNIQGPTLQQPPVKANHTVCAPPPAHPDPSRTDLSLCFRQIRKYFSGELRDLYSTNIIRVIKSRIDGQGM
jgi:hypothetical protein